MSHSDEQKQQILAMQKQGFKFGEVFYEAGLEIKSWKGWFGYSNTGSPNAFGGSAGTDMMIGILDIDTVLHDQEQINIPMRRIVEVRVAPTLP